MEEKDVKFNLVRLTDNEETKQIAVTSDIDDFPDYLDVDDCIAIISSLTSKCVSHLMGTDDDNYIAEEIDEDDEEQAEKFEEVHNFTSNLVSLILNVINNTIRASFNLEPDNIECNVITFENYEDGSHQPLDTFYSDGIRILDPLQSIFPLVVDTTSNLIENGVSKNEVKTLICTALNLLKTDIIKFIDEQ